MRASVGGRGHPVVAQPRRPDCHHECAALGDDTVHEGWVGQPNARILGAAWLLTPHPGATGGIPLPGQAA